MAKNAKVQLVLITPERQVLDETADSVVLPAHDGELGVLPQRAPLMCELGVGQLRFRSGSESHGYYVDGGFAQVYADRVILLTEDAVPVEEISDELVTSAEQKVEQAPASSAERVLAQRRVSVLRRLRN